MTIGADTLWPVSSHDRGATLAVIVVPRASKTGMERLPDGSLRVRLTAPPSDGAANTALLRFLADALDLPRSWLSLSSGATSRRKRIVVDNIQADDLELRVRDALAARQ